MDDRIQLGFGSLIYLVLLWTIGTDVVATLHDVATSTLNDSTQNTWLIRLIAALVFNPISLSVPAVAAIYSAVRR